MTNLYNVEYELVSSIKDLFNDIYLNNKHVISESTKLSDALRHDPIIVDHGFDEEVTRFINRAELLEPVLNAVETRVLDIVTQTFKHLHKNESKEK